MADEIDFDAAASAFPDISLDGDIPTLPVTQPAQTMSSSGFSFDDFDEPKGSEHVRVTGDDELDKFESQFPELEVVSCYYSPFSCLYTRIARERSQTTHSLDLSLA